MQCNAENAWVNVHDKSNLNTCELPCLKRHQRFFESKKLLQSFIARIIKSEAEQLFENETHFGEVVIEFAGRHGQSRIQDNHFKRNDLRIQRGQRKLKCANMIICVDLDRWVSKLFLICYLI